MSKINTNRIETIIPAGTSLASNINSGVIALNNFQTAKIFLYTGAGTETTTKAKIIGILGDNTTFDIKEVTIKVGANKENIIDVVADELAHYEGKAIKVQITGIASSSITLGGIVVLSEPRYQVEDDAVVTNDANDTTEE